MACINAAALRDAIVMDVLPYLLILLNTLVSRSSEEVSGSVKVGSITTKRNGGETWSRLDISSKEEAFLLVFREPQSIRRHHFKR
jgi:hypothetical protein